jgi:YD repeat-containing protein
MVSLRLGGSLLKRLLLASFLCLVFQICTSSPVRAQSSCTPIIWLWYFPDLRPIGFAYYGPGQGPFSYRIWTNTDTCTPPVKETRSDCPFCGHPVSISTGDTFISQRDIRIPGIGGGLSLERRWNSMWPVSQAAMQVGLFGSNWRSTYEERIYTGTDGFLKYSRSDGDFWSFGYNLAAGKFRLVAPANIAATISQGNSYTTLTFQNGEQRRFDNNTGNLIAIVDRNGNTTSLTYDSMGRLVTVTDPSSRHLTFAYTNSNIYLVTGVSSDVGISSSYAYDSQGRLTQVTEQDLSTLNFTYNAQSLINQVTDSQGKILESHTYDNSGRGLTSSQAGGVQSVTVTYP